jgi:ABC-type uncharacterized transport system involved in gliding motility auxiliary subunit
VAFRPRPAAFNADNLITANLESMLLPVAGAIESPAGQHLYRRPPGSTSTNNQMVDAFAHNMDVAALRREFKPSGEVRNLAVRIRALLKPLFRTGSRRHSPNTGEPAAEADINPSEAPLKEGRSAAVIVVVADSDLLYDGYYLSQQNLLGFTISNIFNDNLNFMLNTCEMLTGNPALISIRSRGTFERPFTRVQALERKAQDRWLDQEQALVRQVEETNEKLRLLEQQKDASQRAILSEAQEQEIARFQEEKAQDQQGAQNRAPQPARRDRTIGRHDQVRQYLPCSAAYRHRWDHLRNHSKKKGLVDEGQRRF